ncbi:MAG: SRPBCC family protein [Candidatus Eremiobacteraeota bacterium]|nr:SRPBCC family protein [Candidatus Eremiobacteraeota bacterium]MCW5869856.1 SRPBCC family protein [Candidatus Eremiobacteraeota bacterium]
MSTGTVQLHRILRAKAEKVFRAFVEPDALSRWLPPHGFTCSVEKLEARQGGTFRMSFRNFTSGNSHAFGGTYLEFVPGERLRYTDVFDAPGPVGEMITTIELRAVSCGTELKVVQEGIPAAIPAEQCHLGWQESLEYLARLVEPEIPG